MSRWKPDATSRLQAAALELFTEQGFEGTTVAQIAQRAGLTKRTFFNHFTDKQEVLFSPISTTQQEIVIRAIIDCPQALAPLDAIVHGLQVAADTLFEALHEQVSQRQVIIEANPQLRERESRKRDALTDAIASTLRDRGVDADAAVLTARVGLLIQQTAMQRWSWPTEDRPLREVLAHTARSLRKIATNGRPGSVP